MWFILATPCDTGDVFNFNIWFIYHSTVEVCVGLVLNTALRGGIKHSFQRYPPFCWMVDNWNTLKHNSKLNPTATLLGIILCDTFNHFAMRYVTKPSSHSTIKPFFFLIHPQKHLVYAIWRLSFAFWEQINLNKTCYPIRNSCIDKLSHSLHILLCLYI